MEEVYHGFCLPVPGAVAAVLGEVAGAQRTQEPKTHS